MHNVNKNNQIWTEFCSFSTFPAAVPSVRFGWLTVTFSGNTTAITRCGLLLQTEKHGRSACLSVGHVCEPCKNGLTDQDANWMMDSGGPKIL